MQTPAIEMKGITKIYPNGVVANKDVDFSVDYGEIHAVMGENGAGKSTLMKMLFGLEKIDKGEVLFEGKPIRINSPCLLYTSDRALLYEYLLQFRGNKKRQIYPGRRTVRNSRGSGCQRSPGRRPEVRP